MKIVRENISFERGKDPKKAMNIGHEAKIREMLEAQAYDMRLINLNNYDWDYKYNQVQGYDTFIVHIKKPYMDLPYVGIVPGLWVTSYEESPKHILDEIEMYLNKDTPFT